jgi:hypothetical protein
VLGTSLVGHAAEPPPTLDVILAGFAEMPGMAAHFIEERKIEMLLAPITSQGWLYYAPPSRIAKVTESPVPSRIVADGQRLWFSGGGESGQLDLAAHPIAQALVRSLRLILAGDETGLRQSFDVSFEFGDNDDDGSSHAWSITLAPRHPPLDQILDSIFVRGQGPVLRELQIREKIGDKTTMRFDDVDVTHNFASDETAQIFNLGDDVSQRLSPSLADP